MGLDVEKETFKNWVKNYRKNGVYVGNISYLCNVLLLPDKRWGGRVELEVLQVCTKSVGSLY